MGSPQEVNEFHKQDDVDSSPFAHHHTIGTKPNQAADGKIVNDLVASVANQAESLDALLVALTALGFGTIRAGGTTIDIDASRRGSFNWSSPFPNSCAAVVLQQAGTYGAPFGTVNFMVEAFDEFICTAMCSVPSLNDVPILYIAVGN